MKLAFHFILNPTKRFFFEKTNYIRWSKTGYHLPVYGRLESVCVVGLVLLSSSPQNLM